MQKIEQKGQIKAYLNQGNQLKKEGKLDQAIEQYKQALQLNPNSVPALAELAEIYESRKEFYKAINYLQKLVDINPKNKKFYHKLAAVYSKIVFQEENIDEVLATYHEITKVNSGKIIENVHENVGKILLKLSIRLEQVDRVVTLLQEIIEKQPSSPWLYYNLGMFFAQQDRLNEAIDCYQKSISIQPNFWQAYGELGILFKKQYKLNEAFTYIIKAFQINPNLNPEYRNNLDPRSPEHWDIFQRIFQESIEKRESSKENLERWMGKKLYQKGELSEASVHYQKSIYHQLKRSKPEFIRKHWNIAKFQEPSFLIIGVAKCGTTSLYNYISQHQQFLPAITKEPQYLRSLAPKIKKIEKQGNWSLLDAEKDFYFSHFSPRPKGLKFITGEASTTTIWSKSDKIVKNFCPNVKMIIILRNPVKRAISHYNHLLTKLRQKSTFEEMIIKELKELQQMTDLAQKIELLKCIDWNHHVAPGLYLYYLKRWMNLFPREQFLILTNEDLAQDPAGVMKQTFDFLGLPEYDGIDYTPRNIGSYPKDIDPDLLSRLQDFYRPHNQKLEEFLGRKFNWD